MAQKAKSVALITIHGMGNTPKTYHKLFLEKIRRHLGQDQWNQVEFEPLYYQDILQVNEAVIYKRMKPHIRWQNLRQFILYGFSDAAGLDYRKEEKNSAYHLTQLKIFNTLRSIYKHCGKRNVPVIILAYSLGCHLLSNYIWDSQQADPSAGVWRYKNLSSMDKDEVSFLRLKSLRNLCTVGCNIPVFVAGYKDIQPFKKPNRDFKWMNLYDKDDVLGWPLEPLSASYRKLVKDVPVNASESFSDLALKSWSPFSHEHYLGNKNVIHSVGDALKNWIDQA